MTDDPIQDDSEAAVHPIAAIQRRTVLTALGGVIGAVAAGQGLGLTKQAQAQQLESGLANRSFSQEKLKGEPWVADKTGDFDLADPVENRYATFKVTNNLIGRKTYVPMFSRGLLGPEKIGGAPLYGHAGLWTWQMQIPDPNEFPDAPAGSIVQRAMFTGVVLDPVNYEPTETIYNSYLDKSVEVADSLFAESYLFYPLGGGTSVDRPQFMDDDPARKKSLRPMVRWGDEIALFLDGIFRNEGPHQPRMDSSIWTTSYAGLMDPNRHLLTTDYNFTGLMRAWERPWIGVGKDDPAQLLWNVKGTKLHDVEAFPDLIKRTILAKYPDRV